jgi:hypothetical protein
MVLETILGKTFFIELRLNNLRHVVYANDLYTQTIVICNYYYYNRK